jgi:lysophospholipase L1-like esterase
MFDDTILRRRFEQDSKYFPFSFFIREFGDLKNLKILLFNRFALFRERKTLLLRLFMKERRELFSLSGYYNGFIPYQTTRNLTKEDVVYPKNNSAQIDAFRTLLDELKGDHIKVIFVQIPGYHPGINQAMVLENVKFLKKMAEERGIPFLDYEFERASEINYQSSYFSDVGHLNEKGSDAFSKKLMIDLKEFLI